jgi:hypothetical protein
MDPDGPKHVDPVDPDSDPQHWFEAKVISPLLSTDNYKIVTGRIMPFTFCHEQNNKNRFLS